jgi:predicted Rossmann fold nucleotide-binding protein DprA/Smf involved in DNA uptake
MADTLTKIHADLEKRLKELKPHVEEHAHLRNALDALKEVGSQVHRPTRNEAKPAASAKSTTSSRRGRPSGSGVRAQEALRHVSKQPGITIAALAKKMRIKPNYLYRVLPQLEKDGKIKKDGKGYHPADD